jgi:Xaa-Pro aminopeptidase
VPPTTSIASSAEAAAKRERALEAVAAAGADALVASRPATVRWLLCGRGRPVDAAASESTYTVVVDERGGYVLHPDIETSRVASEEGFEELGFEAVPYPWHEGRPAVVDALLAGRTATTDDAVEAALAPHRYSLCEAERERYRLAAADTADAVRTTLADLAPGHSERDAAARLVFHMRARGLFAGVVLVAGEERQRIHRHPLPTDDPLGRHALLAVTAERDGLYVSLTRLVSFGASPPELAELVAAAAAVDAVMLSASRPGATLGNVFAAASAEYAARGFPDEWRRHHQGGLTGYRGREVFAVPGNETLLPNSCAVAWNPSITGGAKSEDTALVGPTGIEVVTRTPDLGELDVDGIPRPAIVEL